MEKLKEISQNKIFKMIKIVIRLFIAVLIVGFLVVVCLQRFSNNELSFFNYRMFTVISGSMEPKYGIGDVLISKDVEPSTIKEGDTISYKGKVGDFNGKVITHQVVGITKDENGKYLFRAKGLANLVEDPILSEDQLYGVVIYRDPLLSLIYTIISNKIGFYILIIIPVMYIVGSEIIRAMLNNEEKKRKQV